LDGKDPARNAMSTARLSTVVGRAWRRSIGRIDDRGSSPVEFAIVAGAMILLTFAVIQVGLVFHARAIALAAATQGANAARSYGTGTDDAGRAKARTFLDQAGDGLADQAITVGRSATAVTVTVSGTAISVLPGMTFRVSQSASGSIERVT
jgi:Flp pilus assembly protein TadG